MSKQCIAYRETGGICSNGFIQKAFCSGNVGCFSCGSIPESSLPHCLSDDLPDHWLTDDGRPRFVPNGDSK